VGDEIAAGPERAKWFDELVWLERHFRSIPDFNILFKNHFQQLFLSATRPKLPKQKPNKNRRLPKFFYGLPIADLIVEKIWDHAIFFCF
jgi:hypothetical protein